jgi:hypothetical protein
MKSLNKSLGIITPRKINKYFCKATEREWSDSQKAIQDQLDIFEPSVDLEKIPYQFGYEFIDQEGDKHRYTISDWEILQLYRNCRDRSLGSSSDEREQEAVEKVRQKLEDEFLKKKDLWFIVGNLKNHKNTFMIIGLFYPPTSSNIDNNQMSLF